MMNYRYAATYAGDPTTRARAREAWAAARRLGVDRVQQDSATGEWRAASPRERLAALRKSETAARRERLRRLEAEWGSRRPMAAPDGSIPLATVAMHVQSGIPLMVRRDPR